MVRPPGATALTCQVTHPVSLHHCRHRLWSSPRSWGPHTACWRLSWSGRWCTWCPLPADSPRDCCHPPALCPPHRSTRSLTRTHTLHKMAGSCGICLCRCSKRCLQPHRRSCRRVGRRSDPSGHWRYPQGKSDIQSSLRPAVPVQSQVCADQTSPYLPTDTYNAWKKTFYRGTG